MQIKTVCPKCGKKYSIDEEYEGAKVQCESCGQQFVACRMSSSRGAECKGKLPWSSCLLIWLALFAVQGCGYLLATLINIGIDALMINFMMDASMAFDILKVSITFVLTALASYFAFGFIVVKMIVKRLKAE